MRLRYYEYIPGVNQPEEKDIGDDTLIGSEKLALGVGSLSCI
jgi:hypothetical protein